VNAQACPLWLQAVAVSFGFSVPPKVNLNLDSNAAKFRKQRKSGGPLLPGMDKPKGRAKSGHTFSAANPYGKRADSDKRQFTRI
jgi:ATP-dependent RNA helicase DDX18/HAS1